MAYDAENWIDRNVSTPTNYTATKGGGGGLSSGDVLTMIASPGTVTALGTTINAAKMNNVELGVESLYNGDGLYVVTTGSANTYVATFSPTYSAYTTGLTLRVKFNLENTTTSTINVDTLGAKTIKKVTGAGIEVLEAGDIVADGVYVAIYNGTDFILSNQFKVKPMNQVFTSSGTFTAPFTGNYKVTVIGAGGSGGCTDGITATGGGGGGASIKNVSLTKSDNVTVTIGVGGTGVVSGNAGNSGGTTSFGVHCSATGGSGGLYYTASTTSSGSNGGSGSGGDINLSGGQSAFCVKPNGGVSFSNGGHSILAGYNSTLNYGAGSRGESSTSLNGGDGVCIVEWMEG
jgi:hypothetical protein